MWYTSVMAMRRAFTAVELLAVGLVMAVLLVAVIVVLGRSRREARQQKDSQQIRAIHKGLVLFAQSGSDSYPTPSDFDRGNTTLADDGVSSKDLPGHIMSMMIYYGFFSPEVCVSPGDANPGIQVLRKYAYSNPAGAVTPAQALWDPAFRGTPDDAPVAGASAGAPGNLSYAIMPMVGGRRSKWSNDFQQEEAVIGNRGPCYVGVGSGADLSWTLASARGAGGRSNEPVGVGSRALQVHGSAGEWRGLVMYNDNHIVFEKDPSPASTPYVFSGLPQGLRKQSDNLFVNENDVTRAACDDTLAGEAGKNTNNLLRLWSAGKQDTSKRFDNGAGVRPGPLVTIQPWFD
jgi:competence protein ComGC